MSRSRLFRAVGALVASVALVLSGSLTAQAAGNSFSVTVKVVDKDTGKLINDKLSYYSYVLDKEVVFNNGTTVSINKDEVLGDDGEDYGTWIGFVEGTEAYAKYREPERHYYEYTEDCRFYFSDAGKTVTCEAEKKPYSTTLKAKDEDGNSLSLEANDISFFDYASFYGGTLYYVDSSASVGIGKPGYLGKEVTNLVNGGTTTVVLKKAPTRSVTFNFVDTIDGGGLEGTTAVVSPYGRDEEYSVTHGKKVTLPDYSKDDIYTGGSWYLSPYAFLESLSGVNTIEVSTVHVRVVDEAGNPVSGAKAHITETTYNWCNNVEIEERSKDFSSNSDDIVYVSPYSHGQVVHPASGGTCGGLPKIAVSVVAPAGYEHTNSAPVEFLYGIPYDGEDEYSFWKELGLSPDDRVEYVTREETYEDEWGTYTHQEVLGEVVTITLKKKATSVPVSSVKVSGSSSVKVGDSTQLTATVSPSNASDKTVTWKSSDATVATVDASGKVTGKKAGTVTITATAKDGSGKSGSFTVTVKTKWTRLWGNHYFDTMAAISKAGFSDTGGTVVIATSAGYQDALAANSIAGLYDAPILFVEPKKLPAQTQAELKRLKPKKIIVAGGKYVVGDNVLDDIQKATGVKPERRWGQVASDTADDLAKAGKGKWSKSAVVVTDASYWDALSVGPYAYAMHAPIFYAQGGKKLSAATLQTMKDLGITKVYIIGGPYAVSTNVDSQLKAKGVGIAVERVYGQTMINTSQAVAEFALGQGMQVDNMGIATTNGYYDGLAAGPILGKNNSVLVLTDSKDLSAINAVYGKHKNEVSQGYIFGGKYAVSESVYDYVTPKTVPIYYGMG